MKHVTMVRLGLGAAAAILIGVQPAAAQTVAPTGPITASGQLTQSLLGTFVTVCDVTFYGTATASGFEFTSMSGTNVNGGPLACYQGTLGGSEGWVLPTQGDALSATEVKFTNFVYSSRLGACLGTNVYAQWDNATSQLTFPQGTTFHFCRVAGTLTVSPATTIN